MDCFAIYPAESRSNLFEAVRSFTPTFIFFLWAIPLRRNLVKTVSDWVDRRPSIPLSSNWFLPSRPTPRVLFTNPEESPRLTTCARISLFGFKAVFRVGGGGLSVAISFQLNCYERMTSSKARCKSFAETAHIDQKFRPGRDPWRDVEDFIGNRMRCGLIIHLSNLLISVTLLD